jgi:hypothetical protein
VTVAARWEIGMAKTRGTGLFMMWADLDHGGEAEFGRWHDQEYLPGLLQVPGFLAGARYVAVRGGPKHLAMYELEDHHVLRTGAFLDAVRYTPSAWQLRASPEYVGRNLILNGYRQIFPTHTTPIELTAEMPRCVQTGRIDMPAHMEDEFNAWYNTAYIPGYLAVPGAIRARRFVAVEGQPKYLTVYELEHPGVSQSEAWNRARASNPWTARVTRYMQHDEGSPGVYQRVLPA